MNLKRLIIATLLLTLLFGGAGYYFLYFTPGAETPQKIETPKGAEETTKSEPEKKGRKGAEKDDETVETAETSTNPTTSTESTVPPNSTEVALSVTSNFENDLTLVATIIAILSGLGVIFGINLSTRKKRKLISKYLKKIDTIYNENRSNATNCISQLHDLKEAIDNDLKNGKMDESVFSLLIKRIETYTVKVQKQIVNEKFTHLPELLKDELFSIMEDGIITLSEYQRFHGMINKNPDLSIDDRDNLLSLVRDFQKQDELLHQPR